MDIELIRAEIDKRYAEYREKMKTDDFTYYEGMADALDLFEQFLDTLEEPVSDDLEEEVKRYLCEECSDDDEPTVSEIARHFAEWQKAKMMEEWLEDRDGCFWDGVNEGKKAMEEQMMEGAVEAMVTTNLANRPAIYLDQLEGFQYGDKVKIIIVKEDEQ